MTSAPTSKPLAKKKLNWLWIGLCTFAGLTAVFLGWQLILPNPDQNAQPTFWSGVLINVGTSTLLAGILFLLERRFVKDTREVAVAAAQAAATQVVEQTSGANTQLSSRISDLEERLNSQLAQQDKSRDEALDALKLDVSYRSVFSNLKTAYEQRAITRQGLTVPAGPELSSPRVSFVYLPTFYNEDHDGQDEHLKVRYVAEQRSNELGTPVVEEMWHVDEDPTDVFHRLMERMVRAGRGGDKNRLRIADAFRNLAIVLKEAIAARRGDESWQSGGSVVELISDGWVLTENGVEVREHGIVATPKELTKPFAIEDRQKWSLPEKPEWAELDVWEKSMERGSRELPAFSSFPFS
ncbi:hypothetical protein J2Y66_003636 [Paenarthrobacter nitroguajacolicus]|uniref:hypothetical protein n=1 Tax=Paenarthrobacter nitroguajacolicus TaxID=211146 RepID=UPI0028565F01|nr:hypothetical protein [Paenarthrobacter nitroguajacolicus]MDR6989121.1 hypothetical protein [Paenarthrobacter nitroguajacolicus]